MTKWSLHATQDEYRYGGPSGAAQIPAEFLEKLIPGPVTPGQFEDIVQNFKKAFLQQALGAELSHPLGYAPG